MADRRWSDLPEGLLLSFAKQLPNMFDLFSFALVCKPWKSIIFSPPNPFFVPPKPPFLMLAESKINKTTREFVGFNADNGCDHVFELHLPQLVENRCVGSTGNWLVLVNLDQQIHIFNPFSRVDRFQYPSQSTLPNKSSSHLPPIYRRDNFLAKAIILPSEMIAIIYGQMELAIVRPGDESWTLIKDPNAASDDPSGIQDIIYFNNKLYSVDFHGRLAVCDIHSDSEPLQISQIYGDFKYDWPDEPFHYYLVDWMGKLLSVHRYCYGEEDYKTDSFELYAFDFDNKQWEEINNLGRYSVFLGFNSSVALLASESSCFRSNCIYFTDDNMDGYVAADVEGGHDMGVYDLEDKSFKPHYTGISTSLNSPPMWIIPFSVCS